MGLKEDILDGIKGLFSSESKNLATSEQVKDILEKLKTLDSANTDLKAQLEASDKEKTKLQTDLDAAQDKIAALEGQIAELKKGAPAAAAAKAVEIVAAAGIPAEKLPTGTATGNGASDIAQLREQLSKTTDPKERAILSRQIRELISPGAFAPATAGGTPARL